MFCSTNVLQAQAAGASNGVGIAAAETPLVLTLFDVTATLERIGGKDASLARMTRAGLPVPPGFLITTGAYRTFV